MKNIPKKDDDPPPDEYLEKLRRHPMGRRDLLVQSARGLAILTAVAGGVRFSLDEISTAKATRAALLSNKNKESLLAMAEGNFPMNDPLVRLDNFLPQLKSSRLMDSHGIYENRIAYDETDTQLLSPAFRMVVEHEMQWLAPVLHRAVECDNRPMIQAIVATYPSYLSDTINISAGNTYNLTDDINRHHSPVAARVLIDSLKSPQTAYYR